MWGSRVCMLCVFVVLLCGSFCATVLSRVLFGTRVTHYKHTKKKDPLHTNISLKGWLLSEERNQELTKREIRVWIILSEKACRG